MPIPRIFIAALSAAGLLVGAATASATDYWMVNSHTAPSAHCYQGLPHPDLLTAPGGAATSFSSDAVLACSGALAGSTIPAGTAGQVNLWFTNTGRKDCSLPWWVGDDATPTHAPNRIIAGTNYDGGQYITVPAGTTTPTKFTVNFTVDQATTLYPGDQLTLWVDVRTRTGPCSATTLYYGGTGTYASAPSLSLNAPIS